MKRVLITGANGFIGSHLLSFFLKENYDVVGWGRHHNNNDNRIRYVDMADSEAIKNELNSFMPDIVIHCAGSANVGQSVQNPKSDFMGNVVLTHNLLFALHEVHLDHVRVVFLSSAAVYGNPKQLPICEDMPLNPLSPYAVHKVMCEDLCRFFGQNYGMEVKIARIFSAYGRGLKKQIFWDMYQKAANMGCLNMFGTGNESRDYIHIEDVVQSIYLLATSDTEDCVFNIANGEEITIKSATECFAGHMNIRRISYNGVVREGDPLNWCADISRMKKIGYRKTVEIEQGLLDYVQWVSSL